MTIIATLIVTLQIIYLGNEVMSTMQNVPSLLYIMEIEQYSGRYFKKRLQVYHKELINDEKFLLFNCT